VKKSIIVLEINRNHINRGIKYAVKTWTSTFNRMGKGPYQRMMNIIKGVTSEYVLLDYLDKKKIDLDLGGRTRWYEIDRYDIGINNIRVDVKAFFLDLDNIQLQIKGLDDLTPNNTDWLLDCCALVPSDQLKSKTLSDDGYYIFVFITGRFEPINNSDRYFVHAFWEYQWLKPAKWINQHGNPSLGKITIKSDNEKDNGIKMTLIGTNKRKSFYSETLELNNRGKAETYGKFFQVYTLILEGVDLPKGMIQISGSEVDLTEKINPDIGFSSIRDKDKRIIITKNNWNNILMYNGLTYFVGCIKKKDFKEKSEAIKRFYKQCKQYSDTIVDNNKLLVKDLDDISEIIY